MHQGKVKWFNEEKGFGFIVADNRDYFVHFKSIDMHGFKKLKENEEVTFDSQDSPRGKVAVNVRLKNPENGNY